MLATRGCSAQSLNQGRDIASGPRLPQTLHRLLGRGAGGGSHLILLLQGLKQGVALGVGEVGGDVPQAGVTPECGWGAVHGRVRRQGCTGIPPPGGQLVQGLRVDSSRVAGWIPHAGILTAIPAARLTPSNACLGLPWCWLLVLSAGRSSARINTSLLLVQYEIALQKLVDMQCAESFCGRLLRILRRLGL